MTVNQLLSIPMFWGCNHFLDNVNHPDYLCQNKIPSSLTKQSLCYYTKQDKTDKNHKTGVIDHL